MISVCMATYNGEKYIRQQLDSIISQIGKDDEIVISDNESSDKTVLIIKSYNDPRIKLFTYKCDRASLITKVKKDKNITNNFENALKNCRGDFIFLSDQDDIWFQNKIEKQLPLLQKYDLVMSNATLVDGKNNVIKERLYEKDPLYKGIFSFRARGCLFAITRSLLNKALPVPKSVFFHDLWFGILAEYRHSIYFIDIPLVFHRRGIGNASTDVTEKSKNPLWFKIYYRLELLIDGFFRSIRRNY